MEQQQLVEQIAPYKRPDGSYDVRRREKELGISFSASFWSDELQSDDPLLLAMVEINGRQYDEEKAAERIATQQALSRALANTGNEADWRLLEKRGLAVAEYNDAESNAPTGYHLRGYRDIDGNVYSDQAGLEEKPGRL